MVHSRQSELHGARGVALVDKIQPPVQDMVAHIEIKVSIHLSHRRCGTTTALVCVCVCVCV